MERLFVYGTLRPGQIIVAGDQWGRVRALVNDKGDHVKDAENCLHDSVLDAMQAEERRRNHQ